MLNDSLVLTLSPSLFQALLRMFNDSHSFYFSVEGDITHTQQRKMDSSTATSGSDSSANSDDVPFWNRVCDVGDAQGKSFCEFHSFLCGIVMCYQIIKSLKLSILTPLCYSLPRYSPKLNTFYPTPQCLYDVCTYYVWQVRVIYG